jgi:hypothetical protein
MCEKGSSYMYIRQKYAANTIRTFLLRETCNTVHNNTS